MQKKEKRKKNIKIREISPEEFESKLEEDLKAQEEEFNTEQFHEFLQQPSFNSETPVLKQIENLPEQIDLEQNLEAAPSPAEEKKDDAIKYKTISEDYEAIAQRTRETQSRDLVIHQQFQPKRLEEQRINLRDTSSQDFQLNPQLQEIRRQSQGNLEKDYLTNIKGNEFKENKTHSPFEQQEREYKIK